jgi:magnesium-transporting ATPase (P-type)
MIKMFFNFSLLFNYGKYNIKGPKKVGDLTPLEVKFQKEKDENIIEKKLCEILAGFGGSFIKMFLFFILVKPENYESKGEIALYKDKNKDLAEKNSKSESHDYALVVDGQSIFTILSNIRLLNLFLHISDLCSGVVCCRISPMQKVFFICF